MCHTMSHYVTLCQTPDPIYPIYPLPASSSNILQLCNYDTVHPSTDFQDGRHAVLGGDQLWLIDLWRPWPEEQEAPISWLIHGCSCRLVLHSLHCYYIISNYISIYIIQIHTDRFLDLNSDCEISPVQVQSAAISWRPVRTLGQDA